MFTVHDLQIKVSRLFSLVCEKLMGENKDHKTLVLFKKLRSHTKEEQVMQIFTQVLLQLVICCCRNSDLISAVAINIYVKS